MFAYLGDQQEQKKTVRLFQSSLNQARGFNGFHSFHRIYIGQESQIMLCKNLSYNTILIFTDLNLTHKIKVLLKDRRLTI